MNSVRPPWHLARVHLNLRLDLSIPTELRGHVGEQVGRVCSFQPLNPVLERRPHYALFHLFGGQGGIVAQPKGSNA